MKFKGKKILAIFAIILAISIVLLSNAFADNSQDSVEFKGETVQTEYGYKSEFVAPLRYVGVSGTEYVATSVITFPSGKVSTYGRVILDEVGDYEIEYTALVGQTPYTEKHNFEVNIQPKDLWVGDKTDFLTYNNADVPLYNEKGAMLVSAYTKTEVRYANELYLADNDYDEEIMTFLIKPLNRGNSEMRDFIVVIEDATNPSNRIYVKFNRASYEVVKERYSMKVSISTDGEIYSTAQEITKSSFCGRVQNGSDSLPVTVRLDSTSGKIRVECESQSFEFNSKDELQVGTGNAWEGFSNGWGYVYVGFQNRLTNGASSVAVYSVNGVSLGGDEVSDEQLPALTVLSDKISNNTLYAKVDSKHFFPDAKFVCKVQGELNIAKISVYKNENGLRNGVSTKIDGFTPKSAGEYYVEYESESNYNGVKGKGGYKLIVLAESACLIDFEFGSYEPNYVAGDYVEISAHSVSGGRGDKDVTYEVKVGNENVAIENGKFFVEYATTYTLTAICTDDVQTVKFNRDITVSENNNKYVDHSSIPTTVIVGDSVNFDLVDAYKFTQEGKTAIDATITLDGTPVTGEYVFNSAGDKQVVIEGEGVSENFVITAIAPANISGNNNKYITDYFSASNSNYSVSNSGIAISFAQDDTIKFLRPLTKENVTFELSVKSSVAKFDNLEFIFTDSTSSKNSVSFTISAGTADNSEVSVLTYLGKTYEVKGSLLKDSSRYPFVLTYDSDNLALNDGEGKVVDFTRTANGSIFNGFEGDVYLTIKVNGVFAQSEIVLKSIGGQAIKANMSDTYANAGPAIILTGDLKTTCKVGDVYEIKVPVITDVLNKVNSAKVTVTSPDGTKILDSTLRDDLTFTSTEKGDYTIKYESTDDKGNKNSESIIVSVSGDTSDGFVISGNEIITSDILAPEITIGKYVGEAKAGEAFSLAKISVTDNKTELEEIKLYVYVIAPDGVRTLVCCTPTRMSSNDTVSAETKLGYITDTSAESLEFTPTFAGAYRVYYVATDANNLTTIAYYTVYVK